MEIKLELRKPPKEAFISVPYFQGPSEELRRIFKNNRPHGDQA